MKYFLYTILFSLLFVCCNNKKDNIVESISTIDIYSKKYYNKESRDSLANRAIYFNDTIAYKELQEIYYLSNNANELYYYALLMYNRNNYKRSAKDLYFILNKKHIDYKTDSLAQYYLKKSK